MQPVARSISTTISAQTHGVQPQADPRAGGGIQGVIGDVLRAGAAGYQQATKSTGIQADKAAIYPFETVSTATNLLKQKTANIKGVSTVTGLLHTIGGFALLIGAANVTGGLTAPGRTTVDLANRVADLIDGRDTARGWSLGWGVIAEPSTEKQPAAPSELQTALSALGMS